ncbi:hypothetical protein DFH07DRAFT_1067368 [Mycena maculata]|uniref:F-box domain-containing protein n=1 Tax=Mycena maculata TaxID=230809 RepID=A0AAD7HKW5_9AGAR|nr:hypothetical protein DFH07DRAFT_1067368 [Mycena maculata]
MKTHANSPSLWDPSQVMSQTSPAMRFFELRMGPHDLLFAQIPTQDLVRLMCTCRRVYRLVHETCFDISRLLYPFFGDPSEVECFQRIQAQTGTLISGSIALQYFNRLIYPESDLDIYAHRVSAAIPVGFIVLNGYTFAPRKSQDPNVFVQLCASLEDKPPVASYLGRGIADVLDFHKGQKKIQLIIATATPIEIITSFHSTCVMNILTHDNGYAFYPRSTFVTRKALIIESIGASKEAGRQKYVDRGWEMVSAPSVSRQSELGVRMLRWVDDKFTWRMPLCLPRHLASDLSPINSWQLECDDDETWTQYSTLSHPALKQEYIVGDPSTFSGIMDDIISKHPTSRTLDIELQRAIVQRRADDSLQ